ncbi:ALF repeat-containing protein [Kitasatospora sp. NPDC004799]|uniref:ALF repeat-containing protein n=1 Tax=Kitasatospora sp. NPDC004799 TaxID=3154460 RepID=UPI0033AB3B0E
MLLSQAPSDSPSPVLYGRGTRAWPSPRRTRPAPPGEAGTGPHGTPSASPRPQPSRPPARRRPRCRSPPAGPVDRSPARASWPAGGDALRAAALKAFEGTPEEMRYFLEVGRYNV